MLGGHGGCDRGPGLGDHLDPVFELVELGLRGPDLHRAFCVAELGPSVVGLLLCRVQVVEPIIVCQLVDPRLGDGHVDPPAVYLHAQSLALRGKFGVSISVLSAREIV